MNENAGDSGGVSKNVDTMQSDLNMNSFRLTGLPSTLPGMGNDAVSWSQAVQLARDRPSQLLHISILFLHMQTSILTCRQWLDLESGSICERGCAVEKCTRRLTGVSE